MKIAVEDIAGVNMADRKQQPVDEKSRLEK